MDEQPAVAELWKLLQEQRAMMQEQQAKIAQLEEELSAQKRQAAPAPNGHENTPVGIERRLSRAGLLKAAAAGIAGLAAAEVAGTTGAPPVAADSWFLVKKQYTAEFGAGNQYNVAFVTSDPYMELVYGSNVAVYGKTGPGTYDLGMDVYGRTRGITGASARTGVYGRSDGAAGVGVEGANTSGHGWAVRGRSFSGVHGQLGDGIGVEGDSGGGIGVKATSQSFIALMAQSAFPNGASGYAYNTGSGWGLIGRSYGQNAKGQLVLGTGIGVEGDTGSGTGVMGTSSGGGVGVAGVGRSDIHALAGAIGVSGDSDRGSGVSGTSTSGNGVYARTTSDHESAVYGAAINGPGHGYGVLGRTMNSNYMLGNGIGVQGETGGGFGVHGRATGGIGVRGTGGTGRGGVFSGDAAQLQLLPAAAAYPPATGSTGDLFLDSTAKLWLCTIGGTPAVWKTLGTGGGGTPGTDPLVAHSHSPTTPGVLGDNDTDDPASVGVNGKSLQANGHLGNGIGLLGEAGSGVGVRGAVSGGIGVNGKDEADGWGVYGQSQTGTGVEGYSQLGSGVRGVTRYALSAAVVGENLSSDSRGIGVRGRVLAVDNSTGPGTGVQGDSDGGVGVQGNGGKGRGGVFSGEAAQIQLAPSVTQATHPVAGQEGDLFLDSAKRLWLCTSGGSAATWKQVQLA